MPSHNQHNHNHSASGGQNPLTDEERRLLATSFATTTTATPQAYHHGQPYPPSTSAHPPPPRHHQVPPVAVAGQASTPVLATTNVGLLSHLVQAGATQEEMAEFVAHSAEVVRLERVGQELVRRRRLLEASLLTARHGEDATPPTFFSGNPSSYPPPTRPPTRPPASSSPPRPSGSAAEAHSAVRGQSSSIFHSPLHHQSFLSNLDPMPYQYQHAHFSTNSYGGRSMSHPSLTHFAMAPAPGTAVRSGGGKSVSGGASSTAGSTVAPGVQMTIPTTLSSMLCTSGVPHYTARHVIPLGLGREDHDHLTDYLVFVRNECIEIFSATEHDSNDGSARGVVQGQVGMRCRFCAHRSRLERAKRSTSYPSSVPRIYQSLTMMMREHYPCPDMPHSVRTQYQDLKAANTGSRTRESKRYWIASAHRLGLVDTDNGIRMGPPPRLWS